VATTSDIGGEEKCRVSSDFGSDEESGMDHFKCKNPDFI
jgi:hypothetical protein